MTAFPAFRIHTEPEHRAGIETLTLDDLSPGEVLIEAHWSGVNYKDALAGTGRGRILRRSPLVGGIDVSGVVVESADPALRPGDPVLVTGCGLSETRDGGYAARVRAPAACVVPLPAGLDLRQAMILGTAGFTAAAALQRMLDNHQRPELGPIAVTGATGGVGSLAVQILAAQGFEVVALTRRLEHAPWLLELGAAAVEPPPTDDGRPLASARWGGAVDNVGGEVLAALLAATRPWGNVVSIGLAGGHRLHTTVMPFILRGVALLGVTSANYPTEGRRRLWERLGGAWRPQRLEAVVHREIGLDELPRAFEDLLAARVRGRILVRLSP
jgi:putative YhdH/YhfP family quinone oxidoreductase